MAKINDVFAEAMAAKQAEAARRALDEAQAKENVLELLARRDEFEVLALAAKTLLANVELANAYFDRRAKDNSELSLADTEALLANFDTVHETFGKTVSDIQEEYLALRAALESGAERPAAPNLCGCPACAIAA